MQETCFDRLGVADQVREGQGGVREIGRSWAALDVSSRAYFRGLTELTKRLAGHREFASNTKNEADEEKFRWCSEIMCNGLIRTARDL